MTDHERQEFWASLSLKHAPGLGPRTSKRLLDRFGSATRAVEAAVRWREMGLATSQQVQGFLAESWRPHAEEELAKAEERSIPALTWADPRYPERLRQIPDPPVFLYALGDLSLLGNPGVAVVGSRECSRYGIELANRISMELSAQGVTVISGLAYGIDREAHLGGLTGPGSSVAVMGTGPDLVYPAANRDIWRELSRRGLILSEFPPGTKPLAGNFPLRNRIISGLSLGVLVVEATTKSGSLITARLAMEQGREVFAVPGPVSLKSYRGCHEIINKGARLVHCAEDILVEIKPQIEAFLAQGGETRARPAAAGYPEQAMLTPPKLTKAPPRRGRAAAGPEAERAGAASPGKTRVRAASQRPAREKRAGSAQASPDERTLSEPEAAACTPFEQDLAGHLAAMGATHIDSLCRLFGRDASEMSRTLVVLELKGVVRRLPGGYYLMA